MKNRSRPLTPEEIETVRLMYVGDKLTNVQISAKYGKQPNWVNHLATRHGWPLRSGMIATPKAPRAKTPTSMSRGPRPATQAELILQRRAEDAARQKELYGDALPDVDVLKKRGFVLTREDDKIRVGNKLLTFAEMKEMANRERRLAGEPEITSPVRKATKTAGGLKVGDSVALTPKPGRVGTPMSPRKEKLSGAALAAAERAAETSIDLGPPPRMEWIALDRLVVDHSYQRTMGKDNWSHVNRITRDFRWLYCQPLCCAPTKDGKFAVFDGQHRLEASRKHPLIEEMPCYIVEAPGVGDQARAFEALNGRRIGITRLQRFWAAHTAGDSKALRIAAIAKKAGIIISRIGGLLPPKTTFSTFTIEKLFQWGDNAVIAGLKALADAQPKTVNAFRSAIIYAAVTIAGEEGEQFDRARMTAVLAVLDINAEVAKAAAEKARAGGTIERILLAALHARYRKAPK